MLDILRLILHFLTGSYFLQLPDPSLKPQAMAHIIILGASFAGLSTAHRILKEAAKKGPFKITLVSPNTDFYWNMASTRALVPGLMADDKVFQPIAPGFEKYPTSQFEFILATAESIDVEAKIVGISGATGNKTLSYDFLVIATGNRTKEYAPFKHSGSTDATKAALHDFQARVTKAKTIVVAGGGVTGCEAAGELAYEFPQEKKVILVSL